MNHTRFEHPALNGTNMGAMAEWYCTHRAMRIARADPGKKACLAEAAGGVVFQLNSNKNQQKIGLRQISWTAPHGAIVVDGTQPVLDTPPAAGDTLTTLRDPFALVLRHVERNARILE